MGDDLGEEWWNQGNNSDVPEVEEEREEEKPPTGKQPTQKKAVKRKSDAEKPAKTKKKKTEQVEEEREEEKPSAQKKAVKRKSDAEKPAKTKKKKTGQKECFVAQEKKDDGDKSSKAKSRRKKKKKTITDVLACSEPKPGCPADLQNLVVQHFSDKRSVIEMEELKLTLQDSCFLTSNDLTHSLSSYLKEVCPKWAKVQKQHTEKSSVVLLIVCSSALRTIDLIKQLTTFKGEAKVLKLFAKHIKVEEQLTLLQKAVTHIGVGTPGRLRALVEKEGLNLRALRYLVLDWNWRDQKLRRMADVPEVKLDLLNLLDAGILNGCKEGKIKVGLF